MAITTQLLLETEKRFQERIPVHEQRAELLDRVKWHPHVNGAQRVAYLQQLNSSEQTRKRFTRLRPLAAQKLVDATPVYDGTPVHAAEAVFFERVLAQNDLMSISFFEKGLQVSRTVGRVIMRTASSVLAGYGTGFLIGPRLLLTNNHVLPDARSAGLASVEFNYQLEADGRERARESFALDPQAFFITSRELDFTVVAVAETSTAGVALEQYGWNKLIEEEGKIMIGEYMNIIQHPAGRPKALAFRANLLIDILEQHVHYQTDTEPGSSGSPVYNDQWEVVALHHSTVPKRDSQGNFLTRDGQVWRPSMGEQAIDWLANEGVRISRIVKRIKSHPLTTTAERNLRNTIFSVTPNLYAPFGDQRAAEKHSQLSNGYIAWKGNALEYTIPVTIRVAVGALPGAVSSSIAQSNGAASTAFAPGKMSDTQPIDQLGGKSVLNSALQKELAEARAELEASRSRPYYDATADKADIDAYYSGVSLTGSKKKVYDTLSRLLTDTHTSELTYRPARHVYPWVDLQPNRKLRSIYSGLEFEPEVVIEEDFQKEAAILAQMESIIAEHSQDEEAIREQLSLLEASLPYNCEHVVPQSWFGKLEPMKGDLHHLFTCEMKCNSFRGNTPYYDFTDFEEAIRENCGKREENKFEPGSGKGEVARAVLYFLLRYPGEINSTAKEYTPDRIQTLLDWHDAFEVSEYEKHRNAAIYHKQGNRNPLIDFPDLAGKIDFTRGLGTQENLVVTTPEL